MLCSFYFTVLHIQLKTHFSKSKTTFKKQGAVDIGNFYSNPKDGFPIINWKFDLGVVDTLDTLTYHLSLGP